MMVSALVRGQGDRRAAREFRARKQAVDEILLAEIARRRSEPDLERTRRCLLGTAHLPR